jgi:hypothetical protein
MTPKEFVECFYKEKTSLSKLYLDEASNTLVSGKIALLNLGPEQKKTMKEIVDTILTDAFYSILLGLDGEAAIGDCQIEYKIYDEKGNKITSCGELESEAWNLFHGN